MRNPNVRDPRTAAFGFGRRICPGRFFADVSLFATIATALATLHVGRVVGMDGEERIPVVDVTSGLLSHPKPFEYTLRARSDKAVRLLAVALDH
jgi:cytochrome P450